ncbi:MAG: lysophospholipid acyltransferase family protein [Mycobacteriaceae bacterium]|jgi:1-acyl-sn-glycerol-3-phosphate acyltransferase
MGTVEHAWLPKTLCSESCVNAGLGEPGHPVAEHIRVVRRLVLALLVFPTLVLLAVPLPGHVRFQRVYCRMMLRCLGVRITLSGGPIRNLPGVLVVSNHVSWVDVFAIGAVLPGAFVARADLVDWPGLGLAVRLMNVIPIERSSLRRLPAVVGVVAQRLSAGRTVVAFPEGTTWCGPDFGPFRPAMFQAAVDTGRPVQPLRLSYRHRDGSPSTATAFLGEDSLWSSLKRIARARRTVVDVEVRSLQLPGSGRRELATRCEVEVSGRRRDDHLPELAIGA